MNNSKSWLEPSISKRANDITALCDKAVESVDNNFKNLFESVSRNYPDINDQLLEMNDLYFNRQAIIETAYRIGLADGLSLVKNIGPDIVTTGR